MSSEMTKELIRLAHVASERINADGTLHDDFDSALIAEQCSSRVSEILWDLGGGEQFTTFIDLACDVGGLLARSEGAAKR